jgi:hypothetical protein
MKFIAVLFFSGLSFFSTAQSVRLPAGVTMDTLPEGFSEGLYRHHLYKNKEFIAMIVPKTWHNNDTRGTTIATSYEASFLLGTLRKDSFTTVKQALQWLVPVIEEYFSPVDYPKWKSLRMQPPKIRIRYPWEWTYKSERNNSIFQSKAKTNNRLVLLSTNNSEILQVIRTPNTGKLTLDQLILLSQRMNPAINLQQNPLQDMIIGGKTFKTTTHKFMEMMLQQHYWYADEKEIIYIGVGLLREDQVRYPLVIQEILKSIKW